MISNKYYIGAGTGESENQLVAFDKALLSAGVGNYNLVRLSSILPAGCKPVYAVDLPEGSLLPVAYSTATSDVEGETVVSTIGVGIPKDKSKVGIIMEYSDVGLDIKESAVLTRLRDMIREAFETRGWELEKIIDTSVSKRVEWHDYVTTFACIAEWW